jgi:hypothetical protein
MRRVPEQFKEIVTDLDNGKSSRILKITAYREKPTPFAATLQTT